MHRPLAIAAAALVAAGPLSAQADTASSWPVGSRVRVSTPSTRKIVGELSEVRGDTLVIRTGGGLIKFRKKVHADSLLSLEISRDRYVSGRRVAGGAFAGAVGGIALTAVLNAVAGDICVLGACGHRDPDYVRAAIIGGVGGALAGALDLQDRWSEASMPARVLIAPSAGATTIGISLSFR